MSGHSQSSSRTTYAAPYLNMSLEEQLSLAAEWRHAIRNRPRPAAPPRWLRDQWNTTIFGAPLPYPASARATTNLKMQTVWSCKTATVDIHRALRSGDLSRVTPLTLTLAISDRVMQL